MFGWTLQIFGLNDYVGPGATQNIVTAIQRIRYTQGRTNTDRALRFMREEIFARVSTHCLQQGQFIFHFHARFFEIFAQNSLAVFPFEKTGSITMSRFRARLRQASASTLRPLCDDTSNSVLIEINGDA